MTFNGLEVSVASSSLPHIPASWNQHKRRWVQALFRSPWVFPWVSGMCWLLSFIFYTDTLLLQWLALGAAYLASGVSLAFKQMRGSYLFLGLLLLGCIWGVTTGWMTWHWALIQWVNLFIMHVGLQECQADWMMQQSEMERIFGVCKEKQKTWNKEEEGYQSSIRILSEERDRYRAQLEQQQQYVLYVQKELREMIDQKETLAMGWAQTSNHSKENIEQPIKDPALAEVARWKGLYHQLRDQFGEKSATLEQARKKVFELEGELEVRSLEMEETLQNREQLYVRYLDELHQGMAAGICLEELLADAEEWIGALLQEKIDIESKLPRSEDLVSRGSNE